jgi:hypothetical protein
VQRWRASHQRRRVHHPGRQRRRQHPDAEDEGAASKPPAFDKSTLTAFIKSLNQPAAQVKQAFDAVVASAVASKKLPPAAARAYRQVEKDFLAIVRAA